MANTAIRRILAAVALVMIVVPSAHCADAQTGKARQRFIEIEKIARLPADQQKRQIPRLYRELSDGLLSFIIEAILSQHFPTFVTDDPIPKHPYHSGPPVRDYGAKDVRPRTAEDYMTDIGDVAATMTPEEVADAILQKRATMILRVGARRRCLETLAGNLDALRPLIAEDLKSKSKVDVQRALLIVGELRLADFADDLLAIYLDESRGEVAKSAGLALGHVNDPRILDRLAERIGEDGAQLERHVLLLRLLSGERPAHPLIVKFLASPQAETRLAAAQILCASKDAGLVPHVKKLAKDRDTRIREAAARMGCAQEAKVFAEVREDLLPLLKDASIDVRCAAAAGFAEQKDKAAAPVLLELWGDASVPVVHQIEINSAVSRLTGETFGYQPGHWGPGNPANWHAIVKLRDWIRNNAAE